MFAVNVPHLKSVLMGFANVSKNNTFRQTINQRSILIIFSKFYLLPHDHFITSEMCTGSFAGVAGKDVIANISPPGTRCVGPCKYERGRWGSSLCYTDKDDLLKWGAECVQCGGNIFSF